MIIKQIESPFFAGCGGHEREINPEVELYFFYITKKPTIFCLSKRTCLSNCMTKSKKAFLGFFLNSIDPKKMFFLEIIRSRALLLPYLYFRSRALLSKQILSTQKKFQMDIVCFGISNFIHLFYNKSTQVLMSNSTFYS